MNLLSCTLRYLLSRSVLICQSFRHPQLAYFANPLIKGGGNFWKICQNRHPSSSQQKILKDLAKIFWIYRVFWKIWSKGNSAIFTPDHSPPTSSPNINKYVRVCHYNTLWNSVCEIYKNNFLSFNNVTYIISTII